MADTRVVRYVGHATRRVISKADWEAAGVTDQDDVEWGRANHKEVNMDELSDDALKLLSKEPGFVAETVHPEANPDRRPSPQPRLQEDPPTAGT